MTMKNIYRKSSHLEMGKCRQIIRCFAEDFTATQTAKLLWVRRSTVNDRYNYIRQAVYWSCLATDKDMRDWIIEIDESYFWPRRIKWKRGRWAGGKTKVLWLLKREWKVFVQVVPDCSAKSLLPIIRGKIDISATMNTDWRKAYDWLVDVWYEKHYRVHHGKNEFARGKKHINGIESFWSYTKRRLAKFNGITNEKFKLHLKECEFRFNCRLQKEDIYKQLLKITRTYTKLSAKAF